MARSLVLFCILILLNSTKALSQLTLKAKPDSTAKPLTLTVLPQNFYSKHMGYFCKKEVQVQKAIKLPLSFRLGSREYVDYLEQKPNSKLK
ncbi:MAG TPA: hypothetical protein VHK91_08190 [Flavisolibacter sp.]|jgi:hypothetical protein|nr:hypothetical protein [Flavisolibacter sp.]